MEGDAQTSADRDRIAAVVLGPAFPGAVIGPVLHEESGDGFVLLDELQRGHRRIDASGDPHDDARRAHGTCWSNDSGDRRPPR